MSVFVSSHLPDTIIIDLKRMNHLEIDDKNMFAVCEPGVCGAELLPRRPKQGYGVWFQHVVAKLQP
jgi:FAD/FMN-containing dehydrogenase